MTTRQTPGKSAKRGSSPAGRTTQARKQGPSTVSTAKGTSAGAKDTSPSAKDTSSSAKGTPTAGRSGSAAGRSTARNGQRAGAQAAATPTKPSLRGRLAATWQGLVDRAGGGVPLATQIVSVLGIADASYLTYQHFTAAKTFAGCSDKGGINCEAVTTSAWSHFLGMPVSVLGLAFFAFMVVVNSPWGWRAPWAAVHWARLASVIVGIVFVLYLVWAELFRINAICLYCTGVHVLTFFLFALVVGQVTFSGVKGVPARR